jgi:hypothetical protein
VHGIEDAEMFGHLPGETHIGRCHQHDVAAPRAPGGDVIEHALIVGQGRGVDGDILRQHGLQRRTPPEQGPDRTAQHAAAHGERAPEGLVQHVRLQQRAVQIHRQHRQIGAPSVVAAIGVDIEGSGHDMLGPDRFFLVFRIPDTALPTRSWPAFSPGGGRVPGLST